MSRDPKEAVATVNRVLFMEGQVGPSGHVSVRDPDREGVVHINPHTASRGEITPEHVVEVDFENEPLDPDDPDPVSEAEIHTAIYRNRDDIGAVLHLHPEYSTLFGISGTDLLPVHIRGSPLDGAVPVLDRPDKLSDRSDSDPMLEAMGDQKQCLIRGHGSVVCDSTIEEALARAMYIEHNARFQYMASVLGNPNPLSPEEQERLRGQNWKESSIVKRWHFYTWKARQQGYLPEAWD
jgi:L-fuculose-phosphate aldolase